MMNKTNRAEIFALIGFILLCGIVELGGGWLTSFTVETWYPTLVKPSWNPPKWLFGPVWTLLYLLMAIAAWLVWRDLRRTKQSMLPLWCFGLQLGLNFIWSGLFFSLKNPLLGLIDIGFLLVALTATAFLFWRTNRNAGILMLPYLAWVIYAATLNGAIWLLNR